LLEDPAVFDGGKLVRSIRAEIITGVYVCGSIRAGTLLALCCELIEAGHDPAAPLEVYRGEMLSLRVRSIGEGAGLEVNGKGTGFKPCAAVGTASPVDVRGPGAVTPMAWEISSAGLSFIPHSFSLTDRGLL
jgi:hypothetical protein